MYSIAFSNTKGLITAHTSSTRADGLMHESNRTVRHPDKQKADQKEQHTGSKWRIFTKQGERSAFLKAVLQVEDLSECIFAYTDHKHGRDALLMIGSMV